MDDNYYEYQRAFAPPQDYAARLDKWAGFDIAYFRTKPRRWATEFVRSHFPPALESFKKLHSVQTLPQEVVDQAWNKAFDRAYHHYCNLETAKYKLDQATSARQDIEALGRVEWEGGRWLGQDAAKMRAAVDLEKEKREAHNQALNTVSGKGWADLKAFVHTESHQSLWSHHQAAFYAALKPQAEYLHSAQAEMKELEAWRIARRNDTVPDHLVSEELAVLAGGEHSPDRGVYLFHGCGIMDTYALMAATRGLRPFAAVEATIIRLLACREIVRKHDRGLGSREGGLISDRTGTDAARSVDEDQIVKFRAVVAEAPDREYTLPANVAIEDRVYYDYPPTTECAAGITAMRLLKDQSRYFPGYDGLECVNGLDWEDPPIVVEALRADGSVHSRWEFTAFEFDRGILDEEGASYPTYYLGEKEELEREEDRGKGDAAPTHLEAASMIPLGSRQLPGHTTHHER